MSLRVMGGDFQQVALSLGPAQRLVVLRGVVTFVGPRERRFVLSDGYSSIIIAHRLRGALPGLHDRIVLHALITPVGRLLERSLVDQGDHRDTIRLTGFVKYLIPPTSAGLATATEILPAGSCVNGCAVITADDSDQASSGELIPIVLPPSTAAAASAAHKKKKRKRHNVVATLEQAITADPTAALSVSDTQTEPPAPVTLPTATVITSGTIVISAPAAPTTPSTPPVPVVVAPPGSACPAGTVVAVPGYNCVPDCPAGQYLVENSSGTASSCQLNGPLNLTFNPVQLPVPPLNLPPNVCANDGPGLDSYAAGVSCENDPIGVTGLLWEAAPTAAH